MNVNKILYKYNIINNYTSNKWLMKAVSFPQFFNGSLTVIIPIIVLCEAQIINGFIPQAFTPGLESAFTDKPMSLFIKS